MAKPNERQKKKKEEEEEKRRKAKILKDIKIKKDAYIYILAFRKLCHEDATLLHYYRHKKRRQDMPQYIMNWMGGTFVLQTLPPPASPLSKSSVLQVQAGVQVWCVQVAGGR